MNNNIFNYYLLYIIIGVSLCIQCFLIYIFIEEKIINKKYWITLLLYIPVIGLILLAPIILTCGLITGIKKLIKQYKENE